MKPARRRWRIGLLCAAIGVSEVVLLWAVLHVPSGMESEVRILIARLNATAQGHDHGGCRMHEIRDIQLRIGAYGQAALPLVLSEVRKGRGAAAIFLMEEVLLAVPSEHSVPALMEVVHNGDVHCRLMALSTLALLVRKEDWPPALLKEGAFHGDMEYESTAWIEWFRAHGERLALCRQSSPWKVYVRP